MKLLPSLVTEGSGVLSAGSQKIQKQVSNSVDLLFFVFQLINLGRGHLIF